MKNVFRPQDLPKSYIFKQRLTFGKSENYNWHSRVKWYPVGWGLNKKVLSKQFGRLHYLACHAPKPIQKKYRVAYENFYHKHFGTKHASVRYLNNYSCHSWL